MKSELSIVILHYHNPALLKLCLESIKKYPPSVQYEVIVVDSQTYKESRDLIKESFSWVKFVPVLKNTGYAHGVNLGLQVAVGDYLLVLNPDIVLTEGAVDEILNFIKARPDVGLVAPELMNFNGTPQSSYFRFYTPVTILARRLPLRRLWPFKRILSEFLMEDSNPDEIQAPDWVTGGAMMTSRKAMEKVGFLDERFFMYFEDVDWARRFWQNGYKVIYYPKAKIYHAHKRESKSKFWIADIFFNQMTRWHIASAIKYFLKYRKYPHSVNA